MNENITTLSTGLETAGQYPLDGKRLFLTLASMTDLGTGNLKALKYHEGMTVRCVENLKEYIWREAENGEQGEISQNFTYPNGAIAHGIDYSNRSFNFFETSVKVNIADLPVYNSIEEATTALGVDKLFAFSEANIDGVPSPRNSIIGVTE